MHRLVAPAPRPGPAALYGRRHALASSPSSPSLVGRSLLAAPPARARRGWIWPVDGEVITPYRNGDDPYAARPAPRDRHRGAPVGAPWSRARSRARALRGRRRPSGPDRRRCDGRRRASTPRYLHLSRVVGRRRASGSRRARGSGAVGTSGRRSAARAAPALRRARGGQPPRLPRPARRSCSARARPRRRPAAGAAPAACRCRAPAPRRPGRRPRRGARPRRRSACRGPPAAALGRPVPATGVPAPARVLAPQAASRRPSRRGAHRRAPRASARGRRPDPRARPRLRARRARRPRVRRARRRPRRRARGPRRRLALRPCLAAPGRAARLRRCGGAPGAGGARPPGALGRSGARALEPPVASSGRAYYVTTPIYYVNGEPHLGHVYTTIAADVLARHMRQRGEDVFFLTGTDEHGEPVAQAAEREGVTPARAGRPERRAVPGGGAAGERHQRLLHPHERPRARAVVTEVVNRLKENGHVYEGTYEGWYCPRCADFKTEAELIEGNKCPIHLIELEREKEDNWFFRLSAFQERLEQLYADRPEFVLPQNRYNEALSFIKGGLQDLSLSRARDLMGRAGAVGPRAGDLRLDRRAPQLLLGALATRARARTSPRGSGRRRAPDRQGHPQVPRGDLARAADGGRDRAAASACSSTATC